MTNTIQTVEEVARRNALTQEQRNEEDNAGYNAVPETASSHDSISHKHMTEQEAADSKVV